MSSGRQDAPLRPHSSMRGECSGFISSLVSLLRAESVGNPERPGVCDKEL